MFVNNWLIAAGAKEKQYQIVEEWINDVSFRIIIKIINNDGNFLPLNCTIKESSKFWKAIMYTPNELFKQRN